MDFKFMSFLHHYHNNLFIMAEYKTSKELHTNMSLKIFTNRGLPEI